MWSKHNTNGNDKLEYNEIFEIFAEIHSYITLNSQKVKKMTHTSDDLKRLMEMINYEKDGKICKTEFEIFYLRAILAS